MLELDPEVDTLVVLGKGSLAIKVIEFLNGLGYQILVVPVQPEPSWSPSLIDSCRDLDIPTVDWETFCSAGQSYKLGISVYFDKIFKANQINQFQLLLNVHNSDLPKYRGVNPVNWSLRNEEATHGVTIHQVEEGIDTGPIYGRSIFDINADLLEVEDLYAICLIKAYDLFEEIFLGLSGITPEIQNELEATYYSKEDYGKLGDRMKIRRE